MTRCEKYIEQMNAYIDGALPAFEISGLLEHMETCRDCRARFDALKIVIFETQHINVATPAGLHDSIMSHVKRSKKPIKFSYTRIFATVAAAAAITIFAVKSDVVDIGSTFLFGEKPAMTDRQVPADNAENNADNDKGASVQGAVPFAIGEGTPAPDAPSEPSAPLGNANENTPSGSAAEPAVPQKKEKSDIEQAPATQMPATPQPEAGDAPTSNETTTPKANAPQVVPFQAPEQESEYREPFSVPKLATDEEFAFYCIAIGNGKLPNEFTSDMIVGDVKTGPIYIYLKNTGTARKDAEAMLIKAGFAIERTPGNLPQTNSEMEYGLIVVFRK